MAAVAALEITMLLELLPQRDGTARVRLDARDTGRRRRRWRAHDAIQHPDATLDRRGMGAIGGHFQEAGMSEDASAVIPGRERDLPKSDSLHALDPVEFRETRIEHRPVGVDEIGGAQVAAENLVEESPRLPAIAACSSASNSG